MRSQHRNHGARLREYVWQGRRCVSIENRMLRAVLCADKGSDIVELTYKPTDTEVLAQSPRGLGHPADLLASPLAGGPFRDVFPGGWYVMLPNGPEPCAHRGASYGYHGEATFLACDVDVLEDTPDRVAVRFSTRLRRTPIAFERTVSLLADGATLTVDETVTNESPDPLEVLWGHHPTFGGPFLEGARIILPPCRAQTGSASAGARLAPNQDVAWPALLGHDGDAFDISAGPSVTEGSQDFVRLTDLEAPWFVVANPGIKAGIALRWEAALFPVLGLWRVAGGAPEYPWWGRSTLLALEPSCDLPSLAIASERGTAVVIQPHARRSTRLEATVFDGRAIQHVGPGGVL